MLQSVFCRVLLRAGKEIEHKSRVPVWVEFNPPQIWGKQRQVGKRVWELRAIDRGVHERDGPWFVMEHAVLAKHLGQEITLGRSDWAEWSHSGDLVFAKEGQLFRLGFRPDGELQPVSDARQLIDLRALRFEPREAPEEAKQWDC